MSAVQPHGLIFDTTGLLQNASGTRELRVVFSYEGGDPWAISMLVHTGSAVVPWTFARDLLADGLNTPTGAGDVHVAPHAARVRLDLSSPSGQAQLEFARASMEKLLCHTEKLVPLGGESAAIDWDHALTTLVPGGER